MKTNRIRQALLATSLGLVIGLVLAACGPAATVHVSPLSTPTPGLSAGTATPDQAQEMTDLVRQDLAERLAVARDEIQVVATEAQDWPSTALGCPKPGQAYADVITPGYLIVLAAGGQEYRYHTGPNNFVLCQEELTMKKKVPQEEPLTARQQELVEQAQADLAEQLQVNPEAIHLESARAVQWPDSSLGCPKPGMNYLMVVTPGYLIKLEVDGQIYEYHGDEEKVSYCKDPKPPMGDKIQSEEQIMAGLVEAAVRDLVQEKGITLNKIEVVQAHAVQWPDASLGCPQPGKMYAQVVTPGYQIILAADGQEYDYHANQRDVFLCQK